MFLLVILVLVYQAYEAGAQLQGSTCNPEEDTLHFPDEWMNQDNASGPCVVQAVIDKIKCSNIFKPDHGFLRRIAYAETKDGVELPDNHTDENVRHLGIWGLSIDMVHPMALHIKSYSNELKYQTLLKESQQVYEKFDVNFTKYINMPTELNLNNPLVSGLTARYYLSYLEIQQNTSIPCNLSKQREFWGEHYRKYKNMSLIPEFEDIETKGKGQYQCFNCTIEEWMTYENTSGSCIVESVLKQIKDSGLFEEDYRLMRRIAYVETKDGREPKIMGLPYDARKGIWGVNDDMIYYMGLRTTVDLRPMNRQINNTFSIDVNSSNVSWSLSNPLVSAVVAQFYIYYRVQVTRWGVYPRNLDDQADFWEEEYRNKRVTSYIQFKERVMDLEGCRVNADFVFVLDASHSVYEEFSKETNFVIEFIKNLRIGPSDDRVGLVLFGTGAREVFNFSSSKSKEDNIISAIKNITIPMYGSTNIPEGLRLTTKMFEKDYRPLALRIAIVLSDGRSWIDTTYEDAASATRKEAAILHSLKPQVTVYSIGVNYVNKSEMINIAGSEERYTHINSFDKRKLSDTRHQYLTDICCYVNTPLNSSENTSSTLNRGNIMRYAVRHIPVNGITIKVCASKGNVSIFLSLQLLDGSDQLLPLKCGQTHNNVCLCQEGNTGKINSLEELKHQMVKRDITPIEVHITIEGVEDENIFTLEIIDEEPSTDCVGQEGGEECTEKPMSTPDESPSTHKETPSSSLPTKSKKKTVIIASVTSTGSFLICCSVIVGVIIGWVAYRRQKKKKLQNVEEEKYVLLDSEYTEM